MNIFLCLYVLKQKNGGGALDNSCVRYENSKIEFKIKALLIEKIV